MSVLPPTASGQQGSAAIAKNDFAFLNAVDTTQGYLSFGSAPAINSADAVAFQTAGTGSKRQCEQAGDCQRTVSGYPSINESGRVSFLGVRRDFRSQAIFAGNGGPLVAITDTATDSNFQTLGNSAVNASGSVAFQGLLASGPTGIFLSRGGVKDLADTNNPSFDNFLDPVISDTGVVGTAAFLRTGGVEVFTATASGITPRTDPNDSRFLFADNVTINNFGDVAFFAAETVGGEGIFVERTGGSAPQSR